MTETRVTHNEIFEALTRTSCDLAGVFEYDGESGYFYLYRTDGEEGKKILDSVHIVSGAPSFEEADVEIRWDPSELIVGLLVRGVLWAAFDVERGVKYGGGYLRGAKPSIPLDVTTRFEK